MLSSSSFHSCLPAIALATLVSPAAAQFMQLTQSLDPTSPEVIAATYDESDQFVTDATCPTLVPWTRAMLGVPPGGNIDAFSDGSDSYPPLGMALPTIPGQTIVIWVQFSVDRTSVGTAFSPVDGEATSDGAAGDTFAVDLATGGGGHVLITDSQCLTPLAGESNIDAISWFGQTTYPVFYSVDVATAALMQAILPGVTAGDVIIVPAAAAPPAILVSRAGLGLVAGDDIDALAYDISGTQFVFSLTRGSPTAVATPLVGSAGLFTSVGGGTGPWAIPAQLALPASDELDAVRIRWGDPWPWTTPGVAIPGGQSCNGVQLTSNRPVLGQVLQLNVTAPVLAGLGMIGVSAPRLGSLSVLGCQIHLHPVNVVNLGFMPVIGGSGTSALVVPGDPAFRGFALRMQGFVLDQTLSPGGLGASNALTVIFGH